MHCPEKLALAPKNRTVKNFNAFTLANGRSDSPTQCTRFYSSASYRFPPHSRAAQRRRPACRQAACAAARRTASTRNTATKRPFRRARTAARKTRRTSARSLCLPCARAAFPTERLAATARVSNAYRCIPSCPPARPAATPMPFFVLSHSTLLNVSALRGGVREQR